MINLVEGFWQINRAQVYCVSTWRRQQSSAIRFYDDDMMMMMMMMVKARQTKVSRVK